MKFILMVIALLTFSSRAMAQSDSLELQYLIVEALVNNPEIRAAAFQMEVMEAKVPQARALDDPELRYMRMEMPNFRWNIATYSNFELMQMIRFPSKLFAQSDIAKIQAEHAHHDHLEKINAVLAKLKSAYYELWFIQQDIALARENIRLMKQFSSIAQTRYGVGGGSQQDVLKARVELAKLENDLIMLRQKELGMKAILMAILNRAPNDRIGVAVIPDEVVFTPTLDTLQTLALQNRAMLKHDSLSVDENRTMLSLAKQEYLPDLRLGLEYVRGPLDGFRGWTVTAGIVIPFAPWTLGKASGRVDEANAAIQRSIATYNASRNMVLSNVKELYFKAEANKQQLNAYRTKILPQAQQSLEASTTEYQSGRTNFLTLVDAYRTLVELKMEHFMIRMEFEQTIAELERTVGYQNVASIK